MIKVGKQALQGLDLRQIVDDDIRIVRVTRHEVLMMVLGRIEIPARLGFSDDRAIEHMRLVELDDVRLGDAHLLRICRENCRAILRPDIRPLGG